MSTPETPDAPTPDDGAPASELEESLQHLGKAVGGVMTRLFGEKLTGVHVDPERPVIGREVDQAVTALGDTVGRLLHAVGAGLEAHPTEPGAMVDEVRAAQQAPLEVPEGEAPLTVGLRSLGRGLSRSAEALMDKVSPRRPETSGSNDDEDDVGTTAPDDDDDAHRE